MTDTPTHQPPSADESMEIAATYLRIADQAADGDTDAAVDALAAYFTENGVTASYRLWYFAAVGPIIVAAGIRKLNEHLLDGHELWGITTLNERAPAQDPDALAALQAVAAHLNGDKRAAQDVISAHFDAAAKASGLDAAHDAMADMVIHHLNMLSVLIKEGAFPR